LSLKLRSPGLKGNSIAQSWKCTTFTGTGLEKNETWVGQGGLGYYSNLIGGLWDLLLPDTHDSKVYGIKRFKINGTITYDLKPMGQKSGRIASVSLSQYLCKINLCKQTTMSH